MKKLYMILTLILVSTGAFAQSSYQQREADNARWQAEQREIARRQAIENEAGQAAQGGGTYVTPVTQPVVVAQPRTVVVTPQPVVVAPRPVVIGPRPVVPRPVMAPRVYYYAPVPPPVVVPVYPAVVPAPRRVVEAAVVTTAVTGAVVTGAVIADMIKSSKEAKRARKAAEAAKAASVKTVEAENPETTTAPARAAQKRAGITADND